MLKKHYIFTLEEYLNEADNLSSNSAGFSRRHKEGILSAVSLGFFLVLVGMLFVCNPDLPANIIDFVNSFELKTVTRLNMSLPAPKDPRLYLMVYQTAEQFCIVWAVFLVAMLGLKFMFGSHARRKADQLGNVVFWFGAAYLVHSLLVNTTEWFEFWTATIMLIGVSLLVRGIFLIIAWKTRMNRGMDV